MGWAWILGKPLSGLALVRNPWHSKVGSVLLASAQGKGLNTSVFFLIPSLENHLKERFDRPDLHPFCLLVKTPMGRTMCIKYAFFIRYYLRDLRILCLRLHPTFTDIPR
jgi:hypothetical protein